MINMTSKKYLLAVIILIFCVSKNSYAALDDSYMNSGILYGGFLSGTADPEFNPGFRAGLEVSAVVSGGCLFFVGWIGLYADLSYMVSKDINSAIVSMGPEIGFMYIGVDGGLLIFDDNNKTEYGWTIRLLLTIPVFTQDYAAVSLFFRLNHFNEDHGAYEFGVLYKTGWGD